MSTDINNKFRLISLSVMVIILAFLLAVNTPTVRADEFILDWSQIGFVDGTSTLQTFLNVSNSGVEMTTEFRVLDAAFQDIGPYVPGTTTANQGMPRPDGGPLAIRDINSTTYPSGTAGYVLTEIHFSPAISINNLWLEPFFNWTAGGVRKHMALQAFDAEGNAITPISYNVYGGSDLIVENHPSNGQPWLRSSYPNSQMTYSGGTDIEYGDQLITDLHWYSWGLLPNGDFSNVLGSSLLGFFEFTPAPPTAINLVSAQTTAENSGVILVVLMALLLVATTLTIILRQRSVKIS